MRFAPILAAAVALVAAGGASSSSSNSCRVGWWPQPRQSACSNSSTVDPAAPSPTSVRTLKQVWEYDSAGSVSAPVVDAGVVYVQTTDAERRPRLRALDLTSGKQIWEAYGGNGDSPPVVHDDVLLRVSSGWVLRRYGLRHGEIAWRRVVGAPATEGWTGVPLIADRNWYLPNGEELVAYGERTGRPRWARPALCSRCVIAASGGRVYAAGARAVVALAASTGSTVWATRVAAGDAPGSVILAEGRVYTATTGRSKGRYTFAIEALSADTGRRLWRASVGSASYDRIGATPAVMASLLVFPSPDGNVYALDARTGAVRWRQHFGPSDSVPAIANGLVWLASTPLGSDRPASLVALELSGGKRLSTTALHESVEIAPDPSPVVAGGTVLFSTSHRILAFRTAG